MQCVRRQLGVQRGEHVVARFYVKLLYDVGEVGGVHLGEVGAGDLEGNARRADGGGVYLVPRYQPLGHVPAYLRQSAGRAAYPQAAGKAHRSGVHGHKPVLAARVCELQVVYAHHSLAVYVYDLPVQYLVT